MRAVATTCRAIVKTKPRFSACLRFSSIARPTLAGWSSTAGIHVTSRTSASPVHQTWKCSTGSFSTTVLPDSTIYALSTASGRAAIAVIRISGPACQEIYHLLCPGKRLPEARKAAVRSLFEPGRPRTVEHVLDSSALILYFPATKTVTGEDVLELHVHGGPAIVKAVLSAIPKCSSARTGKIRYAEPGEFTRRAFLNDRLDLTQVEALGDTLTATTEQQRRLSVRGTTNKLGKVYESWRHDLLYARGELEALIDFSEDQHFDESPSELCASVARQVHTLQYNLGVHSQNAVRGEMLRHGISIALLGAPNAGKSSLLNRIVGREAAIVSHEAGTTRDVVEVGLDLGGYFCRIGDTAGLRKGKETSKHRPTDESAVGMVSTIEEEGMRRAKNRAAESDVVIVVLNLELLCSVRDRVPQLNLDPEVITMARHLVHEKGNVIVVVNKVDLLVANGRSNPPQTTHVAHPARTSEGFLYADRLAELRRQVAHHIPGLQSSQIHMISCKDPTPDPSNSTRRSSVGHDMSGIQAFLQGLIAEFRRLTSAIVPTSHGHEQFSLHDNHSTAADLDPSIWQESLGASERHRVLLDECYEALDHFLMEVAPAEQGRDKETETEADIVVAAEHLRTAAECLAKITGRGGGGDVEEVLGVVFEKFCVGK